MTDVIELLGQLKGWTPLATLLSAILFGSYRGIWVWGRELREMKESRDKWESIAVRAAGLAEDSFFLTTRKVPRDVS